jgi:hypothetical protein
MRTGLDL